MPVDLDDLFRELTPPPGGAERLRARLAASGRARRWLPVFALTAPAAVAAAVLVLFALPPRSPGPSAALIGVALNPAVIRYQRPAAEIGPGDAVSLPLAERRTHALRRVGGTPDDVLFYWVASIDTPVEAPAMP